MPGRDVKALAAINPEMLDDREFTRYTAEVNTTFTEAQATLERATIAYGNLKTEQITRAVERVFPEAAYLQVQVAVTYHVLDDGVTHKPGCLGHNPTFTPGTVLNVDREPLGTLDPLSPVAFYLENLSRIMDLEAGYLNLQTREWFLPEGGDDEQTTVLDAEDWTGGDDGDLGRHWG